MRLRSLPLWLKYVLTLLVFVPLGVGLVLFINSQANGPAPQTPAASTAAGRAARAVIERDQAVHRAFDSPALRPAVALERAILADVRARIAHHDISGPAGPVSCVAVAHRSAGRVSFRCYARASGVRYLFMGIVDPRARTLTWCKDDIVSAVGSLRVPLNPACTA